MCYAVAVRDTARTTVEGAKEREEKSTVKMKTKKMSLAIDKSKRVATKKDSTGNITMETPRHSQPPFQAKRKSPEVKPLCNFTKKSQKVILSSPYTSSRGRIDTRMGTCS